MQSTLMQLVVVTFERPDIPTELRNQLRQIRERGIARVVDALLISKDDHSELSMLQGADLAEEDAALMGLMAGAFFGDDPGSESNPAFRAQASLPPSGEGIFGMSDDDLFEVADRIPAGAAALFILLEHVWAHGLREAMAHSRGTMIAQGWITLDSLVSSSSASLGATL